MISWHTDESPEDVIWFARNNTNFDEHDFKCLLVLVIGEDSDGRRNIERDMRTALGT